MTVGNAGVSKLRGDGYSHVCSMCEHMHKALAEGRGLCGQENCAGPIGGGSFPKYVGPMSRDAIARSCFACGKEANKILLTPDGFVGSCNEHLRWVSLSQAKSEPIETLTPASEAEADGVSV